jgi:hypothetical protein
VQYEPILRVAPLNMPSVTRLLIKKDKSVDIACGVQGESSWLSARREYIQIDWLYESVSFIRTPLHLPNAPRTGVQL